jgi:tetratricopeptide (TPR) repeat protein
MKNKILLIIILVLISLFFWGFFKSVDDELLADANLSYYKGESAKNLADYNAYYNEALNHYLSLESKYHPAFGNGALYYNIGNALMQLGSYSEAIVYYEKARLLRPRDDRVAFNLAEAEKRLNKAAIQNEGLLDKVFFFHTRFSLPERLQLFFFSSLIGFVLVSLILWKEVLWAKSLAIFSFSSSLLMALSVAYTTYFSPIRGVVVQSVNLLQEARLQSAKVISNPIKEGNIVEIIGISPDGKWLKVVVTGSTFGFVPSHHIKVI